MLSEITKNFIYISIGSNLDLSISILRHTTTKSTNTGKSKPARNGSETVKTVETIYLPQRAIKMFICAIFQSQWDLTLEFYF